MGNKTETVGTGITRAEEIIATMEGTQTTADTQTTVGIQATTDTLIMEDTPIMEDTLITEGTQIMGDTQTTMDTLIMEDILITMLIVGNCNPSLVEVEHLGLMMTAIPQSPLKGDNNIHFRTFVMKFNSTQMCDK